MSDEGKRRIGDGGAKGVWGRVATPLLLLVGGVVLYSIGLGRVHLFDWDEINFAESAREMLVSGNYLDVQVNFETFWEKPPLFIWFQVIGMKLWGIGEVGARFPNAVAGGVTLALLFCIGRREKGERFGLLWALLYGSSLLPFFYFKSGIIDPWFNLFIFLGLYHLSRYTSPVVREGKSREAILGGFFIGLSTLTKGPVGLLIVGLILGILLLLQRGRIGYFRWVDLLGFGLTYCVVGGFWFILQIATGHWSIIEDFFIYQVRLFRTEDAGHGGFLLYHFVVLLFGAFPASLLALPVMRRSVVEDEGSEGMAHLLRYMIVALWVVLILFTVVRTKIVHYSSFCYFPITFLAAYYVEDRLKRGAPLARWVKYSIVAVGGLVALALVVLTNIDCYVDRLTPLVDPFTAGNLSADGGWRGYEWITGLVLLGAVLYFARAEVRHLGRAMKVLFLGCGATMLLGMLLVVPRVEAYSQRALVDFCVARRGEVCYIYPLFKSYAHYFYSDRRPENNCDDKEYLMHGELDRPAYFVVRLYEGAEEELMSECPEATRLYTKNGFGFYVRYPKRTNND